jgi:hypothetical protein
VGGWGHTRELLSPVERVEKLLRNSSRVNIENRRGQGVVIFEYLKWGLKVAFGTGRGHLQLGSKCKPTRSVRQSDGQHANFWG